MAAEEDPRADAGTIRGASRGDEQAPDRSGDANRTPSALDYYGIWKVFDGLIDAAFYGKSRNYALGHRHEQRFKGLWSDGVPVKELLVTQYP